MQNDASNSADMGKPSVSVPLKRLFLEAGFLCLLILCFYSPLLTQEGLPAGADLTSMLWPMRDFTVTSLTHFGSVPLWNPYTFMGMPFAATLQHSVFYPPTIFFQLLSPNTIVGMKWELLFHLCLIGCGAWWFVRLPLALGTGSSLLAGVVFAFQLKIQYSLDNSVILASFGYVPLCLGMVWLLCSRRVSPSRFLFFFSGFAALQFLSGHPQVFLYTRIAEVMMMAGIFFHAKCPLRLQLWHLSLYALAGVIALGLCGLQLLPALELGPTTYREIYKLQYGYALQICHTPSMLLNYLNPSSFENAELNQSASLFSEFLLFLGFIPLVLAATQIGFLVKQKKALTIFLVILAGCFCLCFMLSANLSVGRLTSGEFTTMPRGAVVDSEAANSSALLFLSPLEVLTRVVPLLDAMRAPSRFSLFLGFLLIVLACLGLDNFSRCISNAKARVGLIVSVLILTTANLALVSLKAPFRDLVVPLQTGDSKFIHDQLIKENPTRQFRLTLSDDDRVQATLSPDWEQRQSSMTSRLEFQQENLNVLFGAFNVEGYEEGLAPTIRTKDFLFTFNRHLRTPTPDPVLLHLMGVQSYRSDLPIDPASFEKATPVSNTQMQYKMSSTANLAYWKNQFSGVDWIALDGNYAGGGEPSYARKTELQNYGAGPSFKATTQPLVLQFLNASTIRVSWQGAAVSPLLISMGQSDGWFVNNEPLNWRNAILAEVPLNQLEGRDSVLLQYKPKSAQLGLLITGIALSLWGLLGVIALPKKQQVTP